MIALLLLNMNLSRLLVKYRNEMDCIAFNHLFIDHIEIGCSVIIILLFFLEKWIVLIEWNH